jgi:GAF domain-containing protein
MDPLRLGDEARVALRVEGATWGFMCLHRSGPTGFTAQELTLLGQAAPHVGQALRRLAATSWAATAARSPEAVILAADDTVVAVGGAIEDISCGQG